MRSRLHSVVILVFILGLSFSTIAQPNQQEFKVEGSNGEWFVDRETRVGDAKFENFLGRRSLWLKNNSHVIKKGSEFTDGRIEFELAPMKGGHFTALLFRRASFLHFENIYFRAHKSGQYNAMQYAPAIHGTSTWQLYPEFNRTIDLPENKWTRVRVDVEGTEMKVFVNDFEKPVLVVPRLRSEAKKGMVAFWARINNQPERWASAISNIRITNKNNVSSNAEPTEISVPEGVLDSWQIAKPFENKKGAITKIPELTDWKPARAEESGLINFNRVVGNQRGRWTAFAKTNIRTEKAKTARLNFGYSDDVTIFLNGKPVFSGVNGWEARYPESMGFVKTGNESIYLNLQKGDNELMFAVSNQRFGWGFIAQMEEM